jgi:hypothetical protein
MKLESKLRTLVAVAVAGSFAAIAVPGCNPTSGKDEAKKEKKDDDDDDDDKKKKKKDKDKDKDGEKADKIDKTADKPAEKADKPAADAKTADAAPTVKDNAPPAAPVTDPSQQTYPDVANKIADNCSTPFVIMTTAPNSVGVDYPWTWTRQALLANQQFKVVSGQPSAPGEVTFEVHLASDKFQNAWVLVGKCHDGGTCNKLAAMNKGIIKGSQSQPVCGKLPMDLSASTMKKPVLRELGNPQNTLPSSSDVPGQCARLQACSVAMDPPAKAGKEEIGLECQKSPSKFKTDCATKYPCAEVMKCLDGK